MNRRTKLKLENAKLYARKYCLNSRYMVRNTIAVLSVGALVGTAAFAISDFSFALPTGTGKNASIETAAKDVIDSFLVEAATDGTSKYIVSYDDSRIEEESINRVEKLMKDSDNLSVSAVNLKDLSAANIDVENLFFVKATDLNVRKEASEDSAVIARLGNGACGTVLETKGEWTKIKSGSAIGYVKSEFILLGDEAIKEASARLTMIAVVTEDEVNVRSEGSGEGIILCNVSKDDSFEVFEDFSDKKWVCIRLYDGTYGYISADYVKMNKGLLTAVSQNTIEIYEYAKADAVEKAMSGDETASAILNRDFSVLAETQGQTSSDSDTTDSVSESSDDQSSNDSNSEYESDSAADDDEDSDSSDSDYEDDDQDDDDTDSDSDDDYDDDDDDYDYDDDDDDSDDEDADEEDDGPETTNRDGYETSVSDLYLLAAIVYGESGGECYEGQLAVANVVLNRLYSGYYGSSLADVIYAPYQFTAIYGSSFQNALSTGGSATSLQAAQDALNGLNNIGGYVSFRPTWYLDPSELSDCTVIGNHVFF